MVPGLPILFAAENLPPDLTSLASRPPSVGSDGQLVPILGAALVVAVPVLLVVALTRRQRRKRKVHLPRNPTLAETGGLPPRRASE